MPLVHGKGTVLGAYSNGQLGGVLGMVAPGSCRVTSGELLRFLPTLVTSTTPAGVLRVKRWLDLWGRQDLEELHWHLGPVAVDRTLQGKGVGSRLMAAFCGQMDARGVTSYLETDKSINVTFYERSGFAVLAEEPVLGVANWFMRRPPAARP